MKTLTDVTTLRNVCFAPRGGRSITAHYANCARLPKTTYSTKAILEQKKNMPGKRPLKTISDLNAFNRKRNRRRKKRLERARRSPFEMELASRVMRLHQRRLSSDRRYFDQFPNYDEVILAAAKKASPLRRKRSQSNNRSKPRQNCPLDIGPLTPSVSGLMKRLPRTIGSVVEEYVRKHIGSCKILWKKLPPHLVPLGYKLMAKPTAENIRNDRYVFVRVGRRSSISYGQFQKIFSRARKH